MSDRIRFAEIVPERSTARIRATLKDENNLAIPGASLATCTLTLYNQATGAILNGRDDQDVKASVDANGIITLLLYDADHPIVDPKLQVEMHIALVEFTYGTPVRPGRAEIEIDVRNLKKVI